MVFRKVSTGNYARAVADRPLSQRMGSAVIIGVLVVGAFFVGLALSIWNPFSGFGDDPYTQVGPSVVESVRALADLTTVEMVEYTTVEKGNDAGWLNWARGDRIFLFAVARIGAGVDFDEVYIDSFSVNETSGSVTVQLPPPEITFVEVDPDQTQVYDRDSGVFTKGDAQLESDARGVAQDVLVQAALEKGILEMATENAETTLREFLEGLGYEEVIFLRISGQ